MPWSCPLQLTFITGEKTSEIFIHSLELGHSAATRAIKASGPGSKRLGIDGDREAVPLTLQIIYSKVRPMLGPTSFWDLLLILLTQSQTRVPGPQFLSWRLQKASRPCVLPPPECAQQLP